jgi:hypothetical protein
MVKLLLDDENTKITNQHNQVERRHVVKQMSYFYLIIGKLGISISLRQ